LKYQFSSRNLHVEPERYHFSKTGDGSFISSFLEGRFLRIDQLLASLKSVPVPSELVEADSLPALYSSDCSLKQYPILEDYNLENWLDNQKCKKGKDGFWNTKATLNRLLLNQLKEDITTEEEIILEKLARKFEISRRIYLYYSTDFRKKESTCDDFAVYGLLAINLLVRFKKNNNLMLLNAALKINDMLVSLEVPKRFEHLALYIASSAIETSLVLSLCQSQGLHLK
jgi:hypothetical protein